MNTYSCSILFALAVTVAPAFARCSCEGPQTAEEAFRLQAANSARTLPSESDRQIARNFLKQNMLTDATTYYQNATTKAESEVAIALAGTTSAAELEQTSLHSAAIHREAAQFFLQQGDKASAAETMESALNEELTAHKPNPALAADYATAAKLYEQSGNCAKAADLFKLQADTLAKTHGRYDSGVQAALNEYNRLTRRSASKELSNI